MKIILLKDVGGIGRRGEVKEVADGLAFNKLIPAGQAQQATPEKVKAHAAEAQKEQEQRQREQQALAAKVQSLEGARIEISVRATDKGGLFKSLGVTDIQKAIKEQRNIELSPDAIALEKPIKEVGDHQLIIKTAGVSSQLVFAVKKIG